jgi:SIR2-like domain
MPIDPARQLGYLRQSLVQDRRPLGLLIGAGCAASVRVGGQPLIPAIDGMTRVLHEQIGASELAQPWTTLRRQLEPEANIEELLSHVRSLRAVAGTDAVRGLTANELAELEKEICTVIVSLVDKPLPNQETPFHRVATWIGSSSRAFPVEIFTPNYDLLLEQALEHARVPYFDGFVGTVGPFFDLYAIEVDQLPARWARLWKIHGSINWDINLDTGTVLRREPHAGAAVRLIYPSHLKYDESRRMPYLALIDRLKAFLRQQTAILITCGYSFRDQHLNEVLVQGAQGNASAMIFGLLFGKLDDYPAAVSLASTRSNLTLIAKDGGVIGTRSETWTPLRDEPQEEVAGVEWALGEGGVNAAVTVGDFSVFGELLADVMGDREPIEADAN